MNGLVTCENCGYKTVADAYLFKLISLQYSIDYQYFEIIYKYICPKCGTLIHLAYGKLFEEEE